MSAPKRQRQTQAERTATSQRRLIEAAAELLASEGLAATSLEKVGAAAGYSRGLASASFGSKEGLLRAVIEFLATRVKDDILARRSVDRAPMDEVRTFSELLLSGIRDDDRTLQAYWIMLLATIGNRDPLQADFVAVHREFRGKLVDMISRGQAHGDIDPSLDKEAAGVTIGAILLGASVQILLEPEIKAQPIYETVQAIIAKALAPPAAN